MRNSASSVAFLSFCFLVSVYSIPQIPELYEGNLCKLEDDSEGVCKKLPDCPPILQQVLDGARDADSSGRCGFEGSIEIVCCPPDKKLKLPSCPSAVEGDMCPLENGDKGVCTTVASCPSVFKDILDDKIDDRAGKPFHQRIDDIVCCQPKTDAPCPPFPGRKCRLENGFEGICKELTDCPPRMQELVEGKKNISTYERRSSEEYTQVVCCPPAPTLNLTSRVAITEGDVCHLDNDIDGICTKLTDCPSRMQEVIEGKRDADASARCGFEGFAEIVCCPPDEKPKFSTRFADIACEEYGYLIHPDKRPIVPLAYNAIPALASDYPYVAALGYKSRGSSSIEYICSGTLISLRHVLTAAHCVRNVNNRVPVEVRLGNENIKADAGDVQRIGISDIIVHPRFKRSKNYNDVAVLKLKERIKSLSSVSPVCIETKQLITSSTSLRRSLVLIGWGATQPQGDPSNKLLRTPKLSFMSREECNDWYKDFARLPNGLDDNLFCVIDENKTRGSDACQGDSGGPLVVPGEGRHRLVGVSSFGQGCGGPTPGIYTSVYSFLNWIETQVWKRDV